MNELSNELSAAKFADVMTNHNDNVFLSQIGNDVVSFYLAPTTRSMAFVVSHEKTFGWMICSVLWYSPNGRVEVSYRKVGSE